MLRSLKLAAMPFCMVLCFPLFAQTKEGGLFVEPGITYESSSGDITWPSPFNNSSTELRGFGLSARIGFHVHESVFIGADGRYAMPRFKTSVSGETADTQTYNYGPVVGVQMPNVVGLRVWGAYILDAELDPKAYDIAGVSVDGKFRGGDGFRVGAGFKVYSVSLNLEYQKLKYDNVQVNDIGPFDPGAVFNSVNLDDESWILGVSFPIAL